MSAHKSSTNCKVYETFINWQSSSYKTSRLACSTCLSDWHPSINNVNFSLDFPPTSLQIDTFVNCRNLTTQEPPRKPSNPAWSMKSAINQACLSSDASPRSVCLARSRICSSEVRHSTAVFVHMLSQQTAIFEHQLLCLRTYLTAVSQKQLTNRELAIFQ